MESKQVARAQTWRTTHGDTTDEEWEVIADLVAPCWNPGGMGRPVKVDRRRAVDAIFYVADSGCQWRALPPCYPNWKTVHRYHLTWSRDGTWDAVADRLSAALYHRLGWDCECSQCSGPATVTGSTPTGSLPSTPKMAASNDQT